MLIGTAIGLIVALVNKQKIGDASKKFCRGAGDGFCDVVILIAAAAMFASGMKAIGLTGALVDAMKGSQSVAMFAAAAGPFVMAAISGSGNAAALAFNQAITPNAADFGLTIVQLGAVAQIAAGLGRSMSPVAGGVIILAGIAGDVYKRQVLGEHQSGSMTGVGFDLYTQMLDSAVTALKEGREPNLLQPLEATTDINLHAPALLLSLIHI